MKTVRSVVAVVVCIVAAALAVAVYMRYHNISHDEAEPAPKPATPLELASLAEQDKIARQCLFIGQGHHVGFMSRSGELVTPPRFCYASEYCDDGGMLVCVDDGEKEPYGWYFANSTGAVINTTPVNFLWQYDFANPEPRFTAPDGFAIVSTITNDKAYVHMGSDGRIGSRADPGKHHPRVRYGIVGDKVRLESPAGVPLTDVLYDDALRARGCIPVRIGQKSGFVDEQARPVWPLEFDGVEYSWKGYCKGSWQGCLWIIRQGGLCGAMDEEGRFLVPVRFEQLGAYEYGMMAAKENGKWGVVGKDGSRMIAAAYEEIRFANADSVWCGRDGKLGLYSRNGDNLLPHAYDDIRFESGSPVWCRQEGRWGYVKLDGKWVVPPRYEEAGAFHNGFAAVRQDGKVGLIGRRGRIRVPFRYADAGYVRDGRFPAAVEQDGRLLWGIADLEGNTILPHEYDCVEWDDLTPGKNRYYGKRGWSEIW